MRSTRVSLALLVCLAASLTAQSTGRITGSVVDASGAVVPGAAVRIFFAGGTQPVLSAETTADGLFSLVSVRPALYDLTVEARGFVKTTVRGLQVDAARGTDVPPVKLELPAVTQSIDVTAAVQSVSTSNAEVSSTVTTEQVRRLPLLDRDPLALLYTQPGVVANGRSDTVINGQRASYTNMTLDGINIQDNYIRDNAVGYTPNMLLMDQVSEFTIAGSNASSAMGGGASQVALVTPSGTNQFHGSAYWYNRNNIFSANDWFNNQSGVDRAFLNQNQMGGSLGGPIKQDKLFFYSNYEAYRQHQQTSANRTILTAGARDGNFTYRDSSNSVHTVNLLALRNISVDPAIQNLLAQVPGPDKINNYSVGDSNPGQLRNTAGYRFLQRNDRTRDNLTGKLDYNLSTKQVFTGTFLWNRDDLDRPDYDNTFSPVPKTSSTTHAKLLSLAWRWTPTARLTNEVRGGFNLSPGDFPTTQQFGPYILEVPNDTSGNPSVFSNPVNTSRRQGRNTKTFNFADNGAYQRGRHNVQFGFQMQRVTVKTWDDAGITPTYYLGMSTQNTAALTARDLPGIPNTQVQNANDLLAVLGGFVSSDAQSFNITSRTSGYVPGASDVRYFSLNEYALYAQDNWKVLPRLTVTLGLRYVLLGVPDERSALELTPVVTNNDPVGTLRSNATLDYAGSAAGRPWYGRDKRDFAPNIGLAWDVFGNGKTAVRAAYSINYVNDQTLLATESMLDFNSGLIGYASDVGLTQRVSQGLPAISTPAFQVPRTFADNYALDSTAAFGLVNPNLRTPYVQQWNFGIQQDVKGILVDVRYVGNHTTRGVRAFDVNQVIIRQNGFLNDFIRARNNGFLAQRATGTFNPAYNASIPGSQPLTVFPLLYNGGSLRNAQIRNFIETGEVGELAAQYAENGENGPVQFFPNPNALAADYLTNYSNATYNSLQAQVQRRMTAGLDFQANYTFSKVLSDAAGMVQNRLEHFLDSANPKLDRARADFDLTHMIKGTAIYELPLGKGHRLNPGGIAGMLVSGWSTSGIVTWQSGAPFSILSSRATLNRAGTRSDNNTAVTLLDGSQLSQVVQFRMTGNGPYVVANSAINPQDGTGVSADGAAPFTGQVFFHPDPGTVGTLQRRMFSGPWSFDLDFGVQKLIHIAEKKTVEVRMEGTNILNHPTFYVGDQSIGSTDFGKVTDTMNLPRLVQFGAYLRF